MRKGSRNRSRRRRCQGRLQVQERDPDVVEFVVEVHLSKLLLCFGSDLADTHRIRGLGLTMEKNEA